MVEVGLEIHCNITAKLPATIKNHTIMDRYKEIAGELYSEPKDKKIIAIFLLNDTHMEHLCSTEFSTKIQGWRLLTFLICLHCVD